MTIRRRALDRKATLCERQNYPEFSIDNEPTLLYGRVCCGLGNPGDKRVSRRVLRRGDPCSEKMWLCEHREKAN